MHVEYNAKRDGNIFDWILGVAAKERAKREPSITFASVLRERELTAELNRQLSAVRAARAAQDEANAREMRALLRRVGRKGKKALEPKVTQLDYVPPLPENY